MAKAKFKKPPWVYEAQCAPSSLESIVGQEDGSFLNRSTVASKLHSGIPGKNQHELV